MLPMKPNGYISIRMMGTPFKKNGWFILVSLVPKHPETSDPSLSESPSRFQDQLTVIWNPNGQISNRFAMRETGIKP